MTFTKIVGTNCFVAKSGRKYFAAHHNGAGYELIPSPGGTSPKAYATASEVAQAVRKSIAENNAKRIQYEAFKRGETKLNPYSI